MSDQSPKYQRKFSEQYESLPRPAWAKSASMSLPSGGPCYHCHRDMNPLDNIIGSTSNPNVQENCQAKRLAEGKTCEKPCQLEHGTPDPCLDKVHHFVKGPNTKIKYQDHRDHDIICDEIIGQTPLPANHFTTPHTHGGHSVPLPSQSTTTEAPRLVLPSMRKTVEERKEVVTEKSGPKHVENITMASLPTECKERDAKAWENCLKNIKAEGHVSQLVHGFQDASPAPEVKNTKVELSEERKEKVIEKAAAGKKELQTKASYPTENKANDTKAWEACLDKVKHEGNQSKLVSDFVNGDISGRREEGVHKKESELAKEGDLKKKIQHGELK